MYCMTFTYCLLARASLNRYSVQHGHVAHAHIVDCTDVENTHKEQRYQQGDRTNGRDEKEGAKDLRQHEDACTYRSCQS